MRTWGLLSTLIATAAVAAAADEGAARAAWARQLQDYQQCKARQRAPSYGPAASAPVSRKTCVDPGPFVASPAAAASR